MVYQLTTNKQKKKQKKTGFVCVCVCGGGSVVCVERAGSGEWGFPAGFNP